MANSVNKQVAARAASVSGCRPQLNAPNALLYLVKRCFVNYFKPFNNILVVFLILYLVRTL